MKQLTLLFLQRDEQVLLAMKKRGFGAGRWNGVGGKLDQGETVEQALVRECQEEIEVTPTKYERMAEIVFHEQHEGTKHTLQVHVFAATEWESEPNETEEMAPKWFGLDEIPYDEMWADDPYWLPQVLAGKKLVCEFELDENDQIARKSVKEVSEL
jgi:mutator protein MutT